MPFQTVCPSCGKVGLVRFERIVTGTNVTRHYDCGYCGHRWETPELLPPYPPDPRKPE